MHVKIFIAYQGYSINMQSISRFCNVNTNSASALIEVPYYVRFVIQHVQELWYVEFLHLSGAIV